MYHKKIYILVQATSCTIVQEKGLSLLVKGQFQGPEIPIGELLSLIG